MTGVLTESVLASVDLEDVLAQRAWLRCSDPFPHVIAHDVFTPRFYAELSGALRSVLDRGLSETSDRARFSRTMRGYDAYGLSITHETGGPLALFVSPAWRDLLCGLFGVERTPYVYAGAHHHAPFSEDGFIHNDFNPIWFPRSVPGDEAIVTPAFGRCHFKTGEGTLEPHEKVETVRGAVAILYLLNDGWRTGDGGETALFATRSGPLARPQVTAAPVNNSLVAFECTPNSFHAFLKNHRLPRTSIIMWVHRGLAEASQRYGADRLERWER
ncbi:2OG-Fe(II) oxygenase [Kineosporia sp. J2-2]|uniref:2OG-Fe(II) oxygenase n=1 Tax=Kineosporia corallincola TaxID=2835133 RepID=A0ABS5TF71_9ACTN|nr:2OG-Fe(II) oxygenase [Kineosporia corallincola]MBT0769064.1 2OG-Fe(II) oxygenase [Kineosporia corallincola]